MTLNKLKKRPGILLLISMLLMFLPMLLALITKDTSSFATYYLIFYPLSFMVLLPLLWKLRFSITDLYLVIIYAVILFLPIVRNIFNGTNNSFDTFNSVIKIVNFIVLYVCVKGLRTSDEEINKYYLGLVVFALIAILFSLVTEYDKILSIPSVDNFNLIHITSFFINRNQFGSLMLNGVIATFILMYGREKEKYRSMKIISFILILAMFLTFSRGAVFSLAIFLFTFMLLKQKTIQSRIMLLVTTLVVASLFLLVFNGVLNKFLRIENLGTGRSEIWKVGIDIFKTIPIIGTGYYRGVDIALSRGLGFNQFHNMYIDLFVSGGILELSFVLILLGFLCYKAYRYQHNHTIKIILLSAYITFFVNAFVESLAVLSLGYQDTFNTIFYITLPILFLNSNDNIIDDQLEMQLSDKIVLEIEATGKYVKC